MRSVLSASILLATALNLVAQEGRVPRPQPMGPVDRSGGMGGGRTRGIDQGPVNRPNPGGALDRMDRTHPTPRTRDTEPRRSPVTPRTTAPIVFHPGTHVIVLPAWERCTVLPTDPYWRHRDLFEEIQWISRSGSIPVTAVGSDVVSLVDVAEFPAGWKAYGVAVPAGGKISVELSHSNLGWFRLMAVRKDGTPGPGMLNAMAAHQPVAFTLSNPTSEAGAIYIIVDDPGWMSSKANPYTLTFTRSWDVATTDLSSVKMVTGIWGASPSVSAEFRGPSLTGPAVYPH